jgi:hypothetical protein
MNVHEPDGSLKLLAASHKHPLQKSERDILIHEILKFCQEPQLSFQRVASIGSLVKLSVEALAHNPML